MSVLQSEAGESAIVDVEKPYPFNIEAMKAEEMQGPMFDVQDHKAFVERAVYTIDKSDLDMLGKIITEEGLLDESAAETSAEPGEGQFMPVAPADYFEYEEEAKDSEDETSLIRKEEPYKVRSGASDDDEVITTKKKAPPIQLPAHMGRLETRGMLSHREKRVYRYFRRRRIMDFFKFMMSHLLANEPENPVAFLQGLLDQCLLFRSGHVNQPPILFEDKHIDSIFKALDPADTGFITMEQYVNGMKTMGLKEYIEDPEIDEGTGLISHTEFFDNAKLSLVEDLLDMTIVPPPPEEEEERHFMVYDTSIFTKKDRELHVDTVEAYIEKLMNTSAREEFRGMKFVKSISAELSALVTPMVPEKMTEVFQPFLPPKTLLEAITPPTKVPQVLKQLDNSPNRTIDSLKTPFA